jgi:beta-lactamase class A
MAITSSTTEKFSLSYSESGRALVFAPEDETISTVDHCTSLGDFREQTIMADLTEPLPGFERCRSFAVLLALGSVMAIIAPSQCIASPPEPRDPAKTSPEDTVTLESKLLPIIKAHKGKVAVAVKHLGTREAYRYHAEDVMPTASLIKLPVMIEAYRQAAAKEIDLDAPIRVKKEDKVPGSGVLTYHFSDGITIKLRDAVRLMIVFSDNTATNLVLDAIGIGATATTMEKLGYPNTKIHSKVFRRETSVFPERSKEFGLGSTTADEMLRVCESVYRKEIVSLSACDEMLDHLRACDDKDKFPRFLPPGTKVAFKTGSVSDARTAAGIIESPDGPVAVCVLSRANEDHRWVADNAGNRLCADIARAVFDYYGRETSKDAKPKTAAASSPRAAVVRP